MKQFLPKIKLNNFNIIYITILLLHIFLSNYIFDTYSLDRIVITFYMLFSIATTLIFHIEKIKNKNLFSRYLFILFAYALVQSFLSDHINTQFETAQQQLISLVFLLYIVYYIVYKSSNYFINNFLNLALISTYIISFAIIIDYIVNYSDTYTVTTSILKYFKNIRVLNHLQTIIIPTLTIYMLISRESKKRVLIAVALTLNFLLILHTGARGTLYSIEAAFIFVFISNLNNKTSRNTIFITHLLFAAAAIAYFLIPSIFGGGHSGHIMDISSNGRMLIYRTTLPLIIDSSYFIDAIGFSSQDLAVTHFLHPHNIFLYIFLGTGTFGLASFIVFIVLVIYKSLKQYVAKKNIQERYLYIVFIAPLIHSLVSGIYITPLTSLLYIYFLFIFLEKYALDVSKSKNNTKVMQAMNVFVIIAIVLAIGISLKENLFEKKRYQYNKSETKRLYHPGVMLYSDKIYTEGEKQ